MKSPLSAPIGAIALALMFSILRADTATEATGVSSATSPDAPTTPVLASSPPPHAFTPKGFWATRYLGERWLGFLDEWDRKGITFRPDWTGEVFSNVSGGAGKGVISDGVFELPLKLDFDLLTGGAVKDLTFKINAFYIYGTNLSSAFVHDFSGSSNLAGYNSIRLDELWIQKGLWNDLVTVKVGNQAIDNEFFASSSAALFIGSTFGTFSVLANNMPWVPVYPTASPGVRIALQPDPRWYLMAGVYGADHNLAQNTNDKDGLRFALGSNCDMLVATEVGYLLNQGKNDTGLQGTYRLGALIDTGDFPSFESQANANLNREGRANYVIYGIVDQQIYCDGAQSITIFARPGGAPSNMNFVDYYVDGGFNFAGFIPGRCQDVAGIAVGRSHVSHDFSDMEVSEGERPLTAETYLEATYKLQLTPWWNIQPDVQYVITPSGQAGPHNATILGVRTYVLF